MPTERIPLVLRRGMLSMTSPEGVRPQLRIAQVNDIAYVGTELVAALRQLGQAAELIEAPRPGARWPTPWRELLTPMRLVSPMAVLPRLRGGRYDVIHFHYAWKASAGVFSGRPFVMHCHGTDVRGRTPRQPAGRFIAWIAARAARVYYATPDLAEAVRAFRADAEFLPNPIDVARFRPGSAQGPTRDVLVPVRLDSTKGVETIATVIGLLAGLRPQTSVTLVDQGPGVERVRRAAGGRAAIRAPVRHDVMPDLLRDHRAVLGQFRYGALGNAELEALASGLPVAAAFRYPNAYTSPPPLIAGGVDDPEAMARGLATILDDAAARSAMADASVAWIAATHAAPLVARRLLDAYREALEMR